MRPADRQAVDCTVENADRLPAELRGADAICGPISRAAAANAASGAPSVTIRVVVDSPYKLSVTAMVNGTALPEQKLASADRTLTPEAIERLASTIAGEIASFAAQRR